MESVPPRGRDCVKTVGGCPRLVRGRFTLAARNEQQPSFEDATALRGGVSRFLATCFLARHLAASVNLHGASPWHPKKGRQISFSSNERETPPDKPVASLRVFTQS